MLYYELWHLDESAFNLYRGALNSVFPGDVKFTSERECENKIVFLALKVIRTLEDFQYDFYQKPHEFVLGFNIRRVWWF